MPKPLQIMSVTFVAPMFKEYNSFYMFVSALMCQTNDNWKCIVYHNGPIEEYNFEDDFDTWLSCRDSKFYDKIYIVKSETNTECWGAKNRNEALHRLVDTDFIVQTSIQDYWLPTAVEEILKWKHMDFIYWNSMNHLISRTTPLDSRLQVGWIDWGNFAVKTSIAKQVGINHPEQFCGDGLFVQDLFNSGLIQTRAKISNVLTIHN